MPWMRSSWKPKTPTRAGRETNERTSSHRASAQDHSRQRADRPCVRGLHQRIDALVAAQSWRRQETYTEGDDGAEARRTLAGDRRRWHADQRRHHHALGAAAPDGDDLAGQRAVEAGPRDEIRGRRAVCSLWAGCDRGRACAPQVRDHGRGGGRLHAQGCRRWLARPARTLRAGSRQKPIIALKRGRGAMSEFVVHSVPGSPFGRSVLATLEEKG